MSLQSVVVEAMRRVAVEDGVSLREDLDEESILLESGLDSLGYAIVVAELEDELGYDPFVLMETPVYPRTLGEFVAIYDQFKEHATNPRALES